MTFKYAYDNFLNYIIVTSAGYDMLNMFTVNEEHVVNVYIFDLIINILFTHSHTRKMYPN